MQTVRKLTTSENIFNHAIEHIQARPLEVPIQLNESTDVSFCRQLLVFVRFASDSYHRRTLVL